MIHFYSGLFYEFYNTINQNYQKNSLALIDSSKLLWYLCEKESKSSSMILSVSLPIMTSILLLLLYIVWVSSKSFEEKKLIVIVK